MASTDTDNQKSWKSRHIIIFSVALIVEIAMKFAGELTGQEFVDLFKWTLIALAGAHGWSKMGDK
jgi:hypothetical protein